MSEQELRTALAEYAGPAVPPPGGRDEILARVTAHKRRFRLSAGVAAAAAVATVIAGGLMLRPDGGAPQPLDDWQPERTSNAPYEATACPDALPLPGDANRVLPDLGGVQSVRLCVDTTSRLAGEPVALDEGLPSPELEALVVGVGDLAAGVAALPAADPARCAAISVLPTADALMFVLADGGTVLVPATMCQDVRRGDTTLDGQTLREAFLAALDRQREEVGYQRVVDGDVPCRFSGQPGPVRPGRERLVAAVRCPDVNGSTEPTQLDAARLERLQAAWRDATSAQWQPDEGGDACLSLDDEQPRVVARTDRGDLLWLQPSPCGFLFTDGDPGSHWRIPVTLDGLR